MNQSELGKRILLFGASGMVGQGVLRECLLDPRVDPVVSVGRQNLGKPHEKLQEIARADIGHLSGLDAELTGFDACLFCLGVLEGAPKRALESRDIKVL